MMSRIIPLFVLCFFSFHALSSAEIPADQVGISPSIFEELRLDNKPLNETIRFFNFKDEPVHVHVSVHNWTLDENNKLELLPPNPHSLDQWITINPLEFTVPPGGSRPIRFSIQPRVKPAPGEYRAIVYFSENPLKTTSENNQTLKTRFRIGVGIYAIADSPVKKGSLHSFSLQNNKLCADIENTGNAHIRFKGKYAIWNSAAFPGTKNHDKLFPKSKENEKPDGLIGNGSLNRFPVLPGTRRTIETSLPVIEKSGSYVIAIQDTLAGTPDLHTFRFMK
ncbi:MAG: DUF916 domain-containing protein [Chlorobium sp.]|nr:DUF916 domain-containing protein [Chlorobium sp.]MCW8819828.1 DUF916 domain-containing protein [Ignavibacteriaceae bacterium]